MAAAASCRCSSVVFVGNIPYHAGEEELRAACEEIGPVVSIRRVATDKDKDTNNNRPRRGFALVEYLDDERGRPQRLPQPARRAVTSAAAAYASASSGSSGPCNRARQSPPMRSTRTCLWAYLAGLSRRHVRELVGALGREDPGLVERATREYAGLATLVEQARAIGTGPATRRSVGTTSSRRS